VSTTDDNAYVYDEVKKFVNIYLSIKKIGMDEDGQSYDKNIYIPFRNCEPNDFEKRGYPVNKAFRKDIKKLFCPEIDKYPDLFSLSGKYTNKTHRESFSVEIHNCMSDVSSYCKNETMNTKFHETYYYTMYTLQKRAELVKSGVIADNPIKTYSKFHSQFMLDPSKYSDSNNFMRLNQVGVANSRFNLFDEHIKYEFVDYFQSNSWYGKAGIWEPNSSLDGGKTF
jgi:hypothetical protein